MCVGSVGRQVVSRCVSVRHVVIDAAEQGPPKSCAENLYIAARGLEPTDIVAWLDLDDWLGHDHVLEFIARVYEDPNVWLTYGSYRHADGRPGICAPYETDRYREEPWRASHLKTFRARLLQEIPRADLMGPDGSWLTRAVDQAVMLPMLEMAGPEHARFIPETLVIYNYATSFEHNATPEQLAEERQIAEWIRRKPRYERLESL